MTPAQLADLRHALAIAIVVNKHTRQPSLKRKQVPEQSPPHIPVGEPSVPLSESFPDSSPCKVVSELPCPIHQPSSSDEAVQNVERVLEKSPIASLETTIREIKGEYYCFLMSSRIYFQIHRRTRFVVG